MTPKWILALILAYTSMELIYCYDRGDFFKNLFTKNPKIVGPIIRQPRHHKWRMNYADNDNHDQFTTTQATTVTTTKSPEQIIKEKEEEMRRKNPKGFLIGNKKRKSKDNMFGTVSTIDKEIQKMRKKLEDLEQRCNSNEDCTKDTCCRKDSLSGIGKCVLKPHKLGHACDDQCPCTGSFSCKNIEVVKNNKKVSAEKQCATDNKKIMAAYVKKLKNAKKSSDPKKSKQTQT